ncbi:hypothetical protein ElyMa_001192900 [Elysia marginata]|uniref:Uncharacterized protein n=1 Tax=Elysia marginata TaxID=1093978 RepID=A0AAV4I412_9GAST|nr:hypothetical protein ElyMa_001192900 [Elysia marginata]
MTYCQGLDIFLDQGTVSAPGGRNTCGVLTCQQDINTSVSPTSDGDHTGSDIVFNNISTMSLFMRESKGKRNVEIASITSSSPSLLRVANGKKINGLLEPGRATLRVELFKLEDCQAEFVCEVRGVDSQGIDKASSASLVLKSSQLFDAMLSTPPSLLALIQNLFTMAVDRLEDKMEDRIAQLGRDLMNKSDLMEKKMEERMNSIESGLSSFLLAVKNDAQSVRENITSTLDKNQQNDTRDSDKGSKTKVTVPKDKVCVRIDNKLCKAIQQG